MFNFLPIPFTASIYGKTILASQISPKLIVFAHIPTTIVILVFAIFLYRKTHQVSTLYLLLIAVSFSIWAYCDLLAWTTDPNGIIFGWSVLDMFNVTFTFLTYWFLYAFIKGKDLPIWQKLASAAFLIPTFTYTLLSTNMNSFFGPTQEAQENQDIALYINLLNLLFLIIIVVFTFIEYRKTQDTVTKKKIFLGGLGTALFLSVFAFSFLVTNVLIYFNLGDPVYVYNATTYSLFGMPILMGFLGYLIAKYQAFDLKLLKSVGLILILMLLLFITIFI